MKKGLKGMWPKERGAGHVHAVPEGAASSRLWSWLTWSPPLGGLRPVPRGKCVFSLPPWHMPSEQSQTLTSECETCLG